MKVRASDEEVAIEVGRLALPVLCWSFLVVGLPLALLGATAVVSGERLSAAWIILGLGIALTAAPLVMPRWNRYLPQRFTFRNCPGTMVVTGHDGETAEIPYGDIEGFHIYQDPDYWCVYARGKDRSAWDVFCPSWRSRRKLEEVLALLRARVRLRDTRAPAAPDLPAWIEKKPLGDGAVYLWRQRVDAVFRFGGATMLSGVLGAIIGETWSSAVAATTMVATIVASTAHTLISVRRVRHERHFLLVDGTRVAHGAAASFDAAARGEWRIFRELSRSALRSAQYSYSAAGGPAYVQSILLLDGDGVDYFERLRARDVSIGEVVSFAVRQMRIFHVRFDGRSVPDIVRVARDLRFVLDNAAAQAGRADGDAPRLGKSG